MKKVILILLTVALISCITSCGGKTTAGEFQWPQSELAAMLPIPESNAGHIIGDRTDFLAIEVAKTSKKQYETYVDKCLEKGFVVDNSKFDSAFFAYNESGYRLSLSYFSNDGAMQIFIYMPDEPEVDDSAPAPPAEVFRPEAPAEDPSSTEPDTETNNPGTAGDGSLYFNTDTGEWVSSAEPFSGSEVPETKKIDEPIASDSALRENAVLIQREHIAIGRNIYTETGNTHGKPRIKPTYRIMEIDISNDSMLLRHYRLQTNPTGYELTDNSEWVAINSIISPESRLIKYYVIK